MELEVIFLSPQDHKSGPPPNDNYRPCPKSRPQANCHKQRATEVYQQDTAPGRRGAPKPWTLDRDHKPPPHPRPPAQKGARPTSNQRHI